MEKLGDYQRKRILRFLSSDSSSPGLGFFFPLPFAEMSKIENIGELPPQG